MNTVWAGVAGAMLVGLAFVRRRCTPLDGKVVLITGGSSGIGLAMAKICAARGARIVLIARNKERLAAAREEVRNVTVPMLTEEVVKTCSIDLSGPAEVVEEALRAVPHIDEVDFAVFSAGDSGPAAFQDITAADWERLTRLNIFGCVWAAHAVIPGMKRRGCGRVVFVSSMAARVGVYGYTAYSTTKFGLRGLAEALRMELKPSGIGVTSVLPPDTKTPLLERENLSKPAECKRISEGSGEFTAEAVALGAVDGMARGDGVVWYGIDGWMLSNLTVGMQPVDDWGEALSALLLWPVLRLIAIVYTALHDKICAEEHAKRHAAMPAGK